MNFNVIQQTLLVVSILFAFINKTVAAPVDSLRTSKELYIPKQVWRVPADNDYNNSESEYCYQRSLQSDNIAIFWAKDFGENPLGNPNIALRFDVQALLTDCERFYNFYVDSLKFVEKGKSVTDKYKILFYIFSGDEGTAFGGGEEGRVGILWAPAARVAKKPFGALAHELGHSFQYLVHANGAWGFTSAPEGSRGQPIFEMTSQYMLWQVEPEWLTFENYHLKDFLRKTHYAFLHETNQYHSPFVLEYWSEKHGLTFVGKLWKEAQKGEDVVAAYKRLNSISQEKFNDELFDASRRFVTWDLKRVQKVAGKYANQHSTTLNAAGNGWYEISKTNCPQNYGYNAIMLNVPAAGTKVKIDFKGIAGANGFRNISVYRAGWRYGFLAVKADGARVYGHIFSNQNGTASFKVPDDTKWLWFVVMGAPTEHWEHLADSQDENDEQWPYQLRIKGTSLR